MSNATESSLVFATVMMSDIVDSSSLAYSLPPDVWAEVLQEYFHNFEVAVAAYGGRLEKFIGDAVVAVFGVDTPGEEAAPSAVQAGLQILEALGRAPSPSRRSPGLRTRMAIATGYVAGLRQTSTFAIGDVTTRAARMQEVAPPNEMVIDLATWLQVAGRVAADRMPLPRKHRLAPGEELWRVASRRDQGEFLEPAVDEVAFVERPGLTRALGAAIEASLAGRAEGMIHVTGDIGAGKTRLVREALGRVPTGVVVVHLQWERAPGDCDDLRLAPLYHLLSYLRQARSDFPTEGQVRWSFGLDWSPTDSENGPAQSLNELSCEIAGIIEDILDGRRLILSVDDSHSAPVVARQFLVSLVGRHLDGLVVVTAGRPSAWTSPGQPGVRVIEVGGLSAAEASSLWAGLVEEVELHSVSIDPGADDADTSSDWARNPLYLVQLAALDHTGLAPTGDLSARRSFPPTAEAVIGARIGRLASICQRTLGTVAALGCEIDMALLVELLEEDPATVTASVDVLTRERMLVGVDNGSGGEPTALNTSCPAISEVAYRRMSRRDRYHHHLAIARMISSRPTAARSTVELVAEHSWRAFEEAGRINIDAAGMDEVAEMAATSALGAARYLLSRGDGRQALERAERAGQAALEAHRDDLLLDADLVRSYILGQGGDFGEMRRLSRAGLRRARTLGDPAAELQFGLNDALAGLAERRPPSRARLRALRGLAAGVEASEAALRLALLEGVLLSQRGCFAEAEDRLRHGHHLAHPLTSPLGLVEIYTNLSAALALGDTPASEALGLCRALEDEAAGSELLRAAIRCACALLTGMTGDAVGALAMLRESRAYFEQQDIGLGVVQTYNWQWSVLVRSGDWSAAAEAARQEFEWLGQLGLEAGAAEALIWADALRWVATRTLAPQSRRPHGEGARSDADGWSTRVRQDLLDATDALQRDDVPAVADRTRSLLATLDGVRGAGAVIPSLMFAAELTADLDDPVRTVVLDRLGSAVRRKQDASAGRCLETYALPILPPSGLSEG